MCYCLQSSAVEPAVYRAVQSAIVYRDVQLNWLLSTEQCSQTCYCPQSSVVESATAYRTVLLSQSCAVKLATVYRTVQLNLLSIEMYS